MISMFTCYPVERSLHPLAIYGHTTHGIPGLEISGLGSKGRLIKEKLIFITKKCQFRVPMKRYILCVDVDRLPREVGDLSWCELPLLVLYWSLAGMMARFDPNDAMLAGQITPHGKIIVKSLWPHQESLSELTYLNYHCLPRFLVADQDYDAGNEEEGSGRLAIPLSSIMPACRQLAYICDPIPQDVKITIA